MSARKAYSSNARFIEIAPPGIAFRALVNVDRINLVRFENKIENVPVDDPAAEPDSDVAVEPRITGYKVVVGVETQNNEFTFAQPQVAVDFYNEILDSISRVGAPMDKKPAMELVHRAEPDMKVFDESGDVDEDMYKKMRSSEPLLDSRGRPIMASNDEDDDDAVPGEVDLDQELPGESLPDDDDGDTTQH